jgi:hypothetical protein
MTIYIFHLIIYSIEYYLQDRDKSKLESRSDSTVRKRSASGNSGDFMKAIFQAGNFSDQISVLPGY